MHALFNVQPHFLVRIVGEGERYGLNQCLTHDKSEPLVEFYDTRYPHTEFGQFVSRYSLSTMLGVERGLCLDGGVPAWTISAENFAPLKAALSILGGFQRAGVLFDTNVAWTKSNAPEITWHRGRKRD